MRQTEQDRHDWAEQHGMPLQAWDCACILYLFAFSILACGVTEKHLLFCSLQTLLSPAMPLAASSASSSCYSLPSPLVPCCSQHCSLYFLPLSCLPTLICHYVALPLYILGKTKTKTYNKWEKVAASLGYIWEGEEKGWAWQHQHGRMEWLSAYGRHNMVVQPIMSELSSCMSILPLPLQVPIH